MDTTTSNTRPVESQPSRRVRIDLAVGASLIVTMTVGRLVAEASENGFLGMFGAR